MKMHIEYDDFGEYIEVLEEMNSEEGFYTKDFLYYEHKEMEKRLSYICN